MTEENNLIPVFIPALGVILIAAEDKKSEPLTHAEVLSIRDHAKCIMMDAADADKLAESRGYDDIDPENCWYDWQMLRRELNRKPDLDPGARVYTVRSSDAEYQATIKTAIATLDKFRLMIPDHVPSSAMVKTELTDGDAHAFVWLFNARPTETGFRAELFEVLDSIPGFSVGQTIDVPTAAVLDWMINDDGKLHGGFSLRWHRERLDEGARLEFDRYIGVVEYA